MKAYPQVIKLTNDLTNLIPIGTLHFYNLPFHTSDLGGIAVNGCHGFWKWLDIDYFNYICDNKIHTVLTDIRFLMTFRYIMATYKFYKVDTVTIAKVRIYAVPIDMNQGEIIVNWRLSRPKKYNVSGQFTSCWNNLLSYIDFSVNSWTFLDLSQDILFIDCRYTQSQQASQSNYHIHRWCTNQPYKPDRKLVYNLSQTLQLIYSNIPSPDISKYYTKSIQGNVNNTTINPEDIIIRLVHNMLEGNTVIPGVKTQLYRFQIKSLTKMYEKETNPGTTLVANYIKLKSPIGMEYYYELTKGGIYREPETLPLPKGGILAENMGLGKTLICLSLICLTKWELSKHIPDNVISSKLQIEPSGSLKSLTDICKQAIVQNSLPWKYYISDLPESVINLLNENPGYFRIALENSTYVTTFSPKRSRRSLRLQLLDQSIPQEGKDFRTLYYCNTTLIIVPDNLFHQWNTELKKHIEPSYLNKLFVSPQFKSKRVSDNGIFTNELPNDAKSLIKYDLIVISLSVLARQLDEDNNSCLLRIFWKRLIIDEGHSMTSKSSRASILCKYIVAERRWAVSGTPTSGLTRLHMDQEDEDAKHNSPKRKNKYVVRQKFNEKDDLLKLGVLFANFLKIEPFHSQPKLWYSFIMQPLMKDVYGSTLSLTNLVNSVVIRNSLDEVESDIKLPQLHHVSVFLKPSFHNKLAINIFTAVLAVNAISSERKDIDYMFHPANRQQLRRLITNLQRATLHWSGFKQDDVETLVDICQKCLDKQTQGVSQYTKADTELLHKSLSTALAALHNPRWRTIALLHEMNYYIKGMPLVFTKTFSTGNLRSTENNDEDDIGIFGAPQLGALQEYFYKNRFMDMNDNVKLTESLEKVSKPFWSNYWDHTMKQNNEKFNKQDKEDFDAGYLQEKIKSSIHTPKFKGIQAKFDSKSFEHEGVPINKHPKPPDSSVEHNVKDSVRNAIILGTASSKLSYLASKLLENQHQKVKSIVFFEFEDSAYYLSELLDIVGVNYILYATFINTVQRAQNLSEFSKFPSEQDGGITLIMDLKLAAHGLTIIAATKVYFISPVWRRSIEAQAIKRAHRIGQTKEVYVETLVLEDTLEEEIYRNRLNQNLADDGNKKYVIDDTGMQDFILRHKFLDIDDAELEYAPFTAPTTDETEYLVRETDTSALNNHHDQVHDWIRIWTIFLFNKGNLEKLNSGKNQKITRDFLKEQFINNMVEDEIDNHATNDSVKLPVRKKVRF